MVRFIHQIIIFSKIIFIQTASQLHLKTVSDNYLIICLMWAFDKCDKKKTEKYNNCENVLDKIFLGDALFLKFKP